MNSVDSLKEKARKVFKGLDDADYAILRFFCEKGPTSKYRASRYFEREEEKKPNKKIPRATVYRKIQNLKGKEFLRVVRKEKFKRGSLESDVEILSADTLKSSYALFGSDIDPHKVIELPPLAKRRKSRMMQKIGYEEVIEFYNNTFDSLIEVNEDLTDKKGDSNIIYFLNTLLLLKKPDYMSSLLSGWKNDYKKDSRKALKEFLKVVKYLQTESLGAKRKKVLGHE